MSELNIKAELTSIKPTGYVVADITLDYSKTNPASLSKKLDSLPAAINISRDTVKHLNSSDNKVATQAVINVGSDFAKKGENLKEIVTDILNSAFGDSASVTVNDVYAHVALDITDGSLDVQKLQRHLHHNPSTDIVFSMGDNNKPYFLIPAENAKHAEDFMHKAYDILSKDYTSTGTYESIDLSGDAQRDINNYKKNLAYAKSPSYRDRVSYSKYGDENMDEAMRSNVDTHSRGMYGWSNYLVQALRSLSELKGTLANLTDKDVKSFATKLRSDIISDEQGARLKDDNKQDIKENNGILYDLRNAITGCAKTQAQENKIRSEYLDHFLGLGKYETKGTPDKKPFYALLQKEVDQINDDMRVVRSLKRYALKEEAKAGDDAVLLRSEIYAALLDHLLKKRKLLEKEITQAAPAVEAVQRAKKQFEESQHKKEDKEKYEHDIAAIKASIPNPSIESLIPSGFQFGDVVTQMKNAIDKSFADKTQDDIEFANGVVHSKDSSGNDVDVKYSEIDDNLRDKKEKYAALTKQYYEKQHAMIEDRYEKFPLEEDPYYVDLLNKFNKIKAKFDAAEQLINDPAAKKSTDPETQKKLHNALKSHQRLHDNYFYYKNAALPKAEKEWAEKQKEAAITELSKSKFSDTSDKTWSQVLEDAQKEVDIAKQNLDTMQQQQSTAQKEKDEAFLRKDLMYRKNSDVSSKKEEIEKELKQAKEELEDLKVARVSAGDVRKKDHAADIVNSVSTSLGSPEQREFNTKAQEAFTTAPLSRPDFYRRYAIKELKNELKGKTRGEAEEMIKNHLYPTVGEVNPKIVKAFKWYAWYEYAKKNEGKLPYIKNDEDAARFALNAYVLNNARDVLSSTQEAKKIRGHIEDYFNSRLNASNKGYRDAATDYVLQNLYDALNETYNIGVSIPDNVFKTASGAREAPHIKALSEDARGAEFMHAAFTDALKDGVREVVATEEEVSPTSDEVAASEEKIKQAEEKVNALTEKYNDLKNSSAFLDSANSRFDAKPKQSYVFGIDTGDDALSANDIKLFLDRVVSSSRDMGDGMSHVPLDTRKWLKELLQSFVADNTNLSAASKKTLDDTIENGLINDYTSRVVSEGSKTYNSRTPVDLDERSAKETATSASTDLMDAIANGQLPKNIIVDLAKVRNSVDEFIRVLHEHASQIHELKTKISEDEHIRDDEFKVKYNSPYSKSDIEEHGDDWSETLADMEATIELARGKMKMNITPDGLLQLLKDPQKGASVFEEKEAEPDTLSNDTRTEYYEDLYNKYVLLMGYSNNEEQFKKELKESFLPDFKKAVIKSNTVVNRNEKSDRQKILTEMYNKITDILQSFTNKPVEEEIEHPNESKKVIPTFEQDQFKGDEDVAAGPATGDKAVENKSVFEGKTPKED